LRSPQVTELLNRTLVIVAHPDDESVGAGALIQRMHEVAVVFCTDGGPRDRYFWSSYGTRQDYVRVRHQEAELAAKIGGVKKLNFFSIPDQELHKYLLDALTQLEQLVGEFRPDAILTHAYEGGHPDHDCCAFLSHILAAQYQLPAWEMPLYHRSRQRMICQQFQPPAGHSETLWVEGAELERKRGMVGSYVSQIQALEAFDLQVERFRPQLSYDFLRPPNTELINYEAWQWRMDAAELCGAFSALQDEIAFQQVRSRKEA